MRAHKKQGHEASKGQHSTKGKPPREDDTPQVKTSTAQPGVQRTGNGGKTTPKTGAPNNPREDDTPTPAPPKTLPPIDRPDPGGEPIVRQPPGPERGDEQ
jgi:hypothetical protein